ncbi:MAG: hypothetical protein Q8P19_01080 [bacterium]|nr:hypothetical protein [bacterium]
MKIMKPNDKAATSYKLQATGYSRGVTTLLVLAFMGVFMLILGMITSYAFEEAHYGRALYGREQALAISEAGLEYYKWFLAHNPGDLTNGTGQPGPYTYAVNDPEGGQIGSASISIAGNSQCGVIQSIDITSTGTADLNPSFKRTLLARYMQKSVASYSYLLNSNVLAGADRDITGPYFSNGGIRMDGTNNSDVSSAVSTWNCTFSYGCDPAQPTAPGVVGDGSGYALWDYPVASIDFGGISASLATLRDHALYDGGLYFAPASGSQSQRGYHLIFNGDGTVTVKRVSATDAIPSYSSDTNDLSRYSGSTFVGWTSAEPSIIQTETTLGTYSIPSSCSLIFVEDRAWVEGIVSGKVVVVAATPDDPVASAVPTSAYIPGNITYATQDGTSGLTVIAEDSINIGLNAPDVMEIQGIFVAQGGLYGRNYYTNDYCPWYCVGSAWSSYVLRSELTTAGSIVSNLRTGTAWADGSGNTTSGFQSRIDAYDQLQATNPPPFTPPASIDYGFIVWKEQ